MLGGRKSPDGTIEIVLGENIWNWPKNIASKGLGCCSFRSLDYAARWQYVPELIGLPEKMKGDGVAGGGWPEKVQTIMLRYAPTVPYYQDTTGDFRLLEAMCASKRLPCVDYSGHCPHYSHGIAHCVNVAAASRDKDWVAILDNNYPDDRNLVWMGVSEFCKRWHGWSYGILAETPGKYDPGVGGGGYEGLIDSTGMLTFGLARAEPAEMSAVTLLGKASTVEDVLKAVGPEMVPAKPARPEPRGPLPIPPGLLAHPLVILGGVLIVAYLIGRRKAPPG